MKRRTLMATLALLAILGSACANAAPDTTDAAGEDTSSTDTTDTTDTDDTTDAALEGPYEHLARAEAGEYDGTTVTILSQWIDAEGDNFQSTVAGFAERTGINIQYDGISDYETVLNVRVEGGDPPDLAQLAQPGLMRSFQGAGQLVDLSTFLNLDQFSADYSAWEGLVTVDGGVYGVPFRANGKSIVWYPIAAFEENGYEVPETWDELIALSEQIVADGNGAPWCLSQEHGDATGWVSTDWIEDVLLRTAPAETYDKWVSHEIAFNDPAVLNAAEIAGEVFFTDGFVFGGTTAINSVWVGDTQGPMFDPEGPKCWLHKQAAWIPDFWPKDANEEQQFFPGEHAGFFFLPEIDAQYGTPMLGGGDMFVMFDDRPEVRAVIEYLATADAAKGWIDAGGFLSPNASTPTDWYTTYSDQRLAQFMSEASVVRFDASDTMPAEVGQGTFWQGMVDWVASGGTNTEAVFSRIEEGWPDS